MICNNFLRFKFLKTNYLIIFFCFILKCNYHTSSIDNMNKNNTSDYQIIKSIKASNSKIKTINFDEDGKQIVIGDKDGNIKFWDLKNFENIKNIDSAHNYSIYGLEFFHNNKKLVSGSRSGKIKIWDLLNRNNKDQPEYTFEYTGKQILALKVDHINNLIVYGGIGNSLDFFNYENKQIISKSFPNEVACCFDFSKDGMKLVVGSRKNSISIWDCKDEYKSIRVYYKHTDIIRSITFNKSNETNPDIVASAGKDKYIYIWDIKTKTDENISKIKESHDIIKIKFLSNGLLASANKNNFINFWDIRNTLKPLHYIKLNNLTLFNYINDSNNKDIIVTINKDNFMQIWNHKDIQKYYIEEKIIDQNHQAGISYTFDLNDLDINELDFLDEFKSNISYNNNKLSNKIKSSFRKYKQTKLINGFHKKENDKKVFEILKEDSPSLELENENANKKCITNRCKLTKSKTICCSCCICGGAFLLCPIYYKSIFCSPIIFPKYMEYASIVCGSCLCVSSGSYCICNTGNKYISDKYFCKCQL